MFIRSFPLSHVSAATAKRPPPLLRLRVGFLLRSSPPPSFLRAGERRGRPQRPGGSERRIVAVVVTSQYARERVESAGEVETS